MPTPWCARRLPRPARAIIVGGRHRRRRGEGRAGAGKQRDGRSMVVRVTWRTVPCQADEPGIRHRSMAIVGISAPTAIAAPACAASLRRSRLRPTSRSTRLPGTRVRTSSRTSAARSTPACATVGSRDASRTTASVLDSGSPRRGSVAPTGRRSRHRGPDVRRLPGGAPAPRAAVVPVGGARPSGDAPAAARAGRDAKRDRAGRGRWPGRVERRGPGRPPWPRERRAAARERACPGGVPRPHPRSAWRRPHRGGPAGGRSPGRRPSRGASRRCRPARQPARAGRPHGRRSSRRPRRRHRPCRHPVPDPVPGGVARGDRATVLPGALRRPAHWG